jgi:hypothetical protein
VCSVVVTQVQDDSYLHPEKGEGYIIWIVLGSLVCDWWKPWNTGSLLTLSPWQGWEIGWPLSVAARGPMQQALGDGPSTWAVFLGLAGSEASQKVWET